MRIVAEPLDAVVTLAIADPSLRERVADAVGKALRIGTAERAPRPIVRLRTRARLRELARERIAGAIVVVRVTTSNARHLCELVDGVRADAAGVQLVWDGEDPPRAHVEGHVFAVLEHARSTPAAAPVVLAADAEPALALELLILHRERRS